MSDREFETYLKLLSSLLRLNPKQRQEIAAELRQHLEERVEDLRESGVSHSEAIAMALEEFGDVAGLAAEFSRIGKQKYRRWMMRIATVSVTAAFMVILLFVSQWPEGGRVALVPSSGGQEVEDPARVATTTDSVRDNSDPFGGAAAGNPFDANRPTPESERARQRSVAEKDQITRRRLEEPCNLEISGATINELVDRLNPELPFSALVDVKALEEEGIDGGSGDIKWQWPDHGIATMLELIGEPLGLTYMIRDGILVITTKTKAEDVLTTVVYDGHAFIMTDWNKGGVNMDFEDIDAALQSGQEDAAESSKGVVDLQDLLNRTSMDGQREMALRRQKLREVLIAMVEPLSWEVNGGPTGTTIAIMESKIIVRTTEYVQRRVAQMLETLAPKAK